MGALRRLSSSTLKEQSKKLQAVAEKAGGLGEEWEDCRCGRTGAVGGHPGWAGLQGKEDKEVTRGGLCCLTPLSAPGSLSSPPLGVLTSI